MCFMPSSDMILPHRVNLKWLPWSEVRLSDVLKGDTMASMKALLMISVVMRVIRTGSDHHINWATQMRKYFVIGVWKWSNDIDVDVLTLRTSWQEGRSR